MNVDKDTCIGCGACAGVCPVEALAFDDEGKINSYKGLFMIYGYIKKVPFIMLKIFRSKKSIFWS